MIIAPQHVEGTTENALGKALGRQVDYKPKFDWPTDCMVQWGHGIVPATPFFEAFPPGTFIRGEGATIEEAERDAFAQYLKEFECDHTWGRHSPRRGTYLNGAGWCRKCDAFRGSMFPEVVKLGHWRKPLGKSEQWLLSSYDDEEMNARMDARYPEERGRRARSRRILQIRKHLFGVCETEFG